MDLPTPGSPPISTSEPAHDPAAEHPPELLDPDRQPVEVGDVDLGEAQRPSAAADARHDGHARRAAGFAAAAAVARTTFSSSVLQAWHSGQRPLQRTACAPHSRQTYSVLAFAMSGSLTP